MYNSFEKSFTGKLYDKYLNYDYKNIFVDKFYTGWQLDKC